MSKITNLDIFAKFIASLLNSDYGHPNAIPLRPQVFFSQDTVRHPSPKDHQAGVDGMDIVPGASDMGCVADRLGVPREDVSDLLWICTGERFLTIRKRLRIGDAKRLLLSRPDMTMSEVARTVGFQDKSDFRRAFKEETGYLPRVWRESGGKRLKCRIKAIREAGRNRCSSLHRNA